MKSEVKIGDKWVGDKHPTYIIAEIGSNHNRDINIAKQLIDHAADAGVDAVKFQTFKAERIVSKFAPKADYQKTTTGDEESQFEMIKALELPPDAHRKLMQHCREKDVMFLSTPFDVESINFLYDLGLEILKIPSGEITNLPYLRKVGSLNKKIILSTSFFL